MDEYRVEFFVANADGEEKEILELNEKDIKQWKMDLEARALSEYYNKKVKVSDKKIDFGKRFCQSRNMNK